ncbi:MAG: hypothetical protein EXX96DRAFT_534440 [Benjaminiella poitrasii]|nr:MAG: hypothetical protein EXX96DRAFT_534440 [Benjaminiella poitrasii]
MDSIFSKGDTHLTVQDTISDVSFKLDLIIINDKVKQRYYTEKDLTTMEIFDNKTHMFPEKLYYIVNGRQIMVLVKWNLHFKLECLQKLDDIPGFCIVVDMHYILCIFDVFHRICIQSANVSRLNLCQLIIATIFKALS